jgi:pimeloyl-ACP methyl ester carboxylesterase
MHQRAEPLPIGRMGPMGRDSAPSSGPEAVWMEGVGHMPNLENEAEFNTALASFLRIVDEAPELVELP